MAMLSSPFPLGIVVVMLRVRIAIAGVGGRWGGHGRGRMHEADRRNGQRRKPILEAASIRWCPQPQEPKLLGGTLVAIKEGPL